MWRVVRRIEQSRMKQQEKRVKRLVWGRRKVYTVGKNSAQDAFPVLADLDVVREIADTP